MFSCMPSTGILKGMKINSISRPLHAFGKGSLAVLAEKSRADALSCVETEHHLLTSLLSGFLAPYWEIAPSTEAVLGALEELLPEAQVAFDHFAWRTFDVEHLGIASLARWFTDLGYTRQEAELPFRAKKLRANWYSPPSPELPRIFISELKLRELSPRAQQIIKKYTSAGARAIGNYGPATGLLAVPPWPLPSYADYEALAAESEYASWVLVNGYMLNHCTVSVHRLEGLQGGIGEVNTCLKERGFELNQQGGEVKRGPDGLLLQSSTIADRRLFTFSDGECRLVPSSYIEFAERLVLPEFSHLRADEIEERHRRDGFEVGNAEHIFESTALAARKSESEQG